MKRVSFASQVALDAVLPRDNDVKLRSLLRGACADCFQLHRLGPTQALVIVSQRS